MTQINSMEELIRTHMPAELLDSNGGLRQETNPNFLTLFLNDVTKKSLQISIMMTIIILHL